MSGTIEVGKIERKWVGPLVTVVACATLMLLSQTYPASPNFMPIVTLTVLLSAYMGRLSSGMISILIITVSALYSQSQKLSMDAYTISDTWNSVFSIIASIPLAIVGDKAGWFMDGTRQREDSHKKLVGHLSTFPERNPMPVFEVTESGAVSYQNNATELRLPGLSSLGWEHPFLTGLNVEDLSAGVDSIVREVAYDSVSYLQSVVRTESGTVRFYMIDITDSVQAQEKLVNSKLEIIERLGRAAEWRDEDTGDHITRMSRYCEVLARQAGCDEKACETIRRAAPMHDIGKIGIPDSILLKAGPLTDDEREIMRSHTEIGADLLAGSDDPLLQMAERIAHTHHEWWDGTGYPHCIAGEEIPLEGRIAAICDVFDALTSERPYKRAWTVAQAVQTIKDSVGTQFDPVLVEHFLEVLPQVEAIRYEYRFKKINLERDSLDQGDVAA